MKYAPAVLAASLLTTPVMALGINFDNDAIGSAPVDWSCGVTGSGSARWAVTADPSAPSKANVLMQSGRGAFPWCIKSGTAVADGFVKVKFKAISGRQDQAGGVVWRWKGGDKYYVARANALENNISLYYTEGGSRKTLKYVDAPVKELAHLPMSDADARSALHLILGSAQVPGHRAPRLKSTEAVLMLFKAQAGRRRPTALDLLFALAQHIDARATQAPARRAIQHVVRRRRQSKQLAVSILRDMLITVVPQSQADGVTAVGLLSKPRQHALPLRPLLTCAATLLILDLAAPYVPRAITDVA
ncbi:MAG: hypothetical protein IPK34_13310 [Ramlibacter sp.]|nr:hypothetical protein [Ramlibacter sp.]